MTRSSPTPSVLPGWSVVDLCCGVGGMSLAAKQLGLSVACGVDVSGTALASFKHNFPDACPMKADISKAKTVTACAEVFAGLPLDQRKLILSGPPCQGFSAAGPRINRDPRNRIIMAVAKAIVALRPDAAIVENVSALLTAKHAKRFARFKKIIADGGYNLQVLPLNAATFGVPQTRHRVICIISREPIDLATVRARLSVHELPTCSVRTALGDLPEPPEYDPLSITRPPIENHVAMRHSARVKRKIAKVKEGAGPMSYRKLSADKPSRTLISGNRAPPAHYSAPRSITVREAARLQGFPDDFVVKGTFANQMVQVTNAVPPPFARAVIATLIGCLEVSDGRKVVRAA